MSESTFSNSDDTCFAHLIWTVIHSTIFVVDFYIENQNYRVSTTVSSKMEKVESDPFLIWREITLTKYVRSFYFAFGAHLSFVWTFANRYSLKQNICSTSFSLDRILRELSITLTTVKNSFLFCNCL